MANKTLRLALSGPAAAPKLLSALQLAYGITGRWERICVIGSSRRDALYQHLGSYTKLTVPPEASPQRYTELLNLCAACHKEVVILSALSREWQSGVAPHAGSSVYEDLLRSHRLLLEAINRTPVHVIACLDTERVFLPSRQPGGRRRLFGEQVIQLEGIEEAFTAVLRLDKAGMARVRRDNTDVFDRERPVRLAPHHGAVLSDWCREDLSPISAQMQERIESCTSIDELHKVLFELDLDDKGVIAAFMRRRTELDLDYESASPLQALPGGLL